MAKIEIYEYRHKDEILPHMRRITVIWLEDTQKDLNQIAEFTGCTCKRLSDNTLEVYTRPNIGHHIHVGEGTFVYRQVKEGVVGAYCYNLSKEWVNANYERVN